MVERVTELMMSQDVVTNVDSDMTALTQTESELASGKRINQPSDDPYGTSVILDLNDNLSEQTNYSNNNTDGTAWLNTASSALTSINNAVETIRELVVEGANDTNSSSDDQSAASEVNELIDEIKQEANSQYDGNYVFSGSDSSTAPYATGSNDTYQGNSGSVTRQIGANESVQVNTDLSSVLGNGSGSNDGLLLDTLRQVATDLQNGSQTGLETDLGNLDTNVDSLQALQSNVGVLTDRLSDAASEVQSEQSADNTQLASTQDADEATLTTQYSTESAAYEAALEAGAKIIEESLTDFLSS